ncbi:hypothetical protein WMF28_16465 [Sorangium sp. So ce590]|uniref:hypothetical protein n=1 Tax=Sorangium sp. So ce590 TaxID=3133317 RepID=UPI003F638918
MPYRRLPPGTRHLLALALAAALAAPAAPAHAETCTSTERKALPDALPMRDFAMRLGARIDACATEARRPDAERFCAEHRIECSAARVRDFVRVRTLFEMTRDGGPFRLRWSITDRDPTARHIWAAWRQAPPLASSDAPSATAECDELSALFAGLARRLDVRGVGLFWPTSNHTIAAWDVTPAVRVLVPTSQIFLGCDATFDQTTFLPSKQRVVYELRATDVPDAVPVPRALATFLLDQIEHYAGASLDMLAMLRTHRALRFDSSLPAACGAYAAAAAKSLRARPLSPPDRRALMRYGSTELGLAGLAAPSVEETLERLAR